MSEMDIQSPEQVADLFLDIAHEIQTTGKSTRKFSAQTFGAVASLALGNQNAFASAFENKGIKFTQEETPFKIDSMQIEVKIGKGKEVGSHLPGLEKSPVARIEITNASGNVAGTDFKNINLGMDLINTNPSSTIRLWNFDGVKERRAPDVQLDGGRKINLGGIAVVNIIGDSRIHKLMHAKLASVFDKCNVFLEREDVIINPNASSLVPDSQYVSFTLYGHKKNS